MVCDMETTSFNAAPPVDSTKNRKRTALITVAVLVFLAISVTAVVFLGAIFLFSVGADREIVENGAALLSNSIS